MNRYDVVIIWWGPSWSSLWILLAKKWKKVLILEKSMFPKHSIWESLLPDTTDRFLKILYWWSYVWWKSSEPWHLIFDWDLDNKIIRKKNITNDETQKILNSNYKYSYQVNRYIFDKILSDRAKKVWVVFLENKEVIDLLYNNFWDIIWVKTKDKINYFWDLIVDAWWRSWFIRNKLGISKKQEDLWFFSIYTYFKNCEFYDNFYSKYTQLVISIDIWWVWFIHIWNWIVSIWIVTNDKTIRKEELLKKLKNTKYIKDSIKCAKQCDYLWNESKKIYSISNWSNISKKLYWKNFILIWDAWGFVDPILSWGISFAINTAFVSYVHIIKYLKEKNINIFKNYENLIYKDINDYLWLAKFWYWSNKVIDSYFWLAKKKLWLDLSNRFNRLAFIYLSSWSYYSDRNLRLFNWELKIWDNIYDKHERIRIENLIQKSNICDI